MGKTEFITPLFMLISLKMREFNYFGCIADNFLYNFFCSSCTQKTYLIFGMIYSIKILCTPFLDFLYVKTTHICSLDALGDYSFLEFKLWKNWKMKFEYERIRKKGGSPASKELIWFYDDWSLKLTTQLIM